MKKTFVFLVFILFNLFCYSQQIKVAIVDFDNTSGISKYDGLGKAMSSMLISDIEANVSPKRLQLVERSQINKILKEQNFQKTSSVEKASTVKMGKLLGVKYLLVGDIFILNDALVINSRLVDTETGDIKFTEKKEGKLTQWLFLKTDLAKGLSTSISMPFTEPVVKDIETQVSTMTSFGNAIVAKDDGDFKKAEILTETLLEQNPELSYLNNLKNELDEIKKDLAKINEKVDDALNNPEELALELIDRNYEIKKALNYLNVASEKKDFYSQFGQTKSIFIHHQKAKSYYRIGEFESCLIQYDSCISIDKNYLFAHFNKMHMMMGGEFANVPSNVKILNPNKDYNKEILSEFDFITSYNKSNVVNFNKSINRSTFLNDGDKCYNNPLNSECDFFSFAIELPLKNAKTVFDDLFRDLDVSKLYEYITYPTNDICRYLLSKKEKELPIQILENSISQQFEFISQLHEHSDYYKSDRNFHLLEKSSPLIVGDNRLKYIEILTNYSDFLIDENSLSDQSIFDNILLLAQLYISNNKPKQGIELIDNFRLITQKNISKEGTNAFQLAYFKFYLKQLMMSELTKNNSDQSYYKCSKIYEDIKFKLPNYFTISNMNFKSYYEQQLEKEKKLYSQENLLFIDKYLKENPKIANIENQNYKSVKEISKYYLYNNKNKTHIVHAFVDSIYEAKDFPKEYYLTMDCTDGFGNERITINANKNMFEEACHILESSTNNNRKVTLVISLDEYGKISLLDIEMGWLNYSEMNFSGKLLYEPNEFANLLSNQKNNSLELCLNNLSGSSYYDKELIMCFKEIGLEKSYEFLKNNSELLNNLAWAISNSNSSSEQEYRFANQMAERASYIAFDTDHNLLDTYAFTLLKIGQKDKSKEMLNKAINIAKARGEYEATKKYQDKLKNY